LANRNTGGKSGLSRVDRRSAGIPSSKTGGIQSETSEDRSPSGNPCLLIGRDGACVGGVRRASGLYEIVSGFSMLLLCIVASISLGLAFPIGKRPKLGWLALSATSLIGSGLFLVAAITGEVWLFGI
jgi:hypothetical protein